MLNEKQIAHFGRVISNNLPDRCDILRATPEILKNGTTIMQHIVIERDLKCRLSRATAKKEREDAELPLTQFSSEAKLFLPVDARILPNDEVMLRRFENPDIVMRFCAGEPFYYETHLELPLYRKTDA